MALTSGVGDLHGSSGECGARGRPTGCRAGFSNGPNLPMVIGWPDSAWTPWSKDGGAHVLSLGMTGIRGRRRSRPRSFIPSSLQSGQDSRGIQMI
jgi:hypothetical protein